MKPKRKTSTTNASSSSSSKKARQREDFEARRDPESRGVHADGMKFELSTSNRATCVTCKRKIEKDELRWGLKYAGNPITGETVLPLYGSHPMYMWNHATCGFSFERYSRLENLNKTWIATRTCHLCEDCPSQGESDLRLRCGGPLSNGGKVLFHHFHLKCVKNVLEQPETPETAEIRARAISGWEDLSEEEKQYAEEVFP